MTDLPGSQFSVANLRNTVVPSFALLGAVQLDLFTVLVKGPMDVGGIASALGVGTEKLGVLLYALAYMGALEFDGSLFSNSQEAQRSLVRGKETYLGDMVLALPERWEAVLKIADSIRSGKAEAKVDYSVMSAEELESHYRTFYYLTVSTGKELASRYDFSSCRHLADVAGGTGGLAIALVQAHPQMEATILDLPGVTSVTRRFVDESGVADRVSVADADIVNGLLEGSFDVAVMSAIFPVLAPQQIPLALKNVNSILKPGGTLYITDAGFLDDSRMSPGEAIINNLWFINVFDNGGARTEEERVRWLNDAGFNVLDQVVLPNGRGIMKAYKPA